MKKYIDILQIYHVYVCTVCLSFSCIYIYTFILIVNDNSVCSKTSITSLCHGIWDTIQTDLIPAIIVIEVTQHNAILASKIN